MAETRPDSQTDPAKTEGNIHSPVALAIMAALAVGALAFAYFDTLRDLVSIWSREQDYSHGFVVAPIAAYMIWRTRSNLKGLKLEPSLLGVVLLAAALVMRCIAVSNYYGSLDRFSLVVAFWGLVLLIAGRKITLRIIIPLLFLLLMLPPERVITGVTLPLQGVATFFSALLLNVMGWGVRTAGNVIRLYGQEMEIAAACSGLRMLLAIMTLGFAMAYLRPRPVWERVTIAVMSLFVALGVNVIRIVATGIITQIFLGKLSPVTVHDWAGWLMMPVALIVIRQQQYFLENLFLPDS